MAMEVETLELTIEDIVRLHRGYITDLFVEDKKTEVEIVQLLYEHRLFVSLPQIQNCLRDWGLLSTRSPSLQTDPEPELEDHSVLTTINTELQLNAPALSDDSATVYADTIYQPNSGSRLSASSNQPFLPNSPTYTPSPVNADFDPETANLCKERPLPILPTTSGHKRRSSQLSDRSRKDKLRLTCHHGDEFHAVEMTLEILPQGPSPIERYASEDQGYERIPLNMERTSELLPTLAHRKAGKWSGKGKGTGYRTEKGIKKRLRDGKDKEDSKSR